MMSARGAEMFCPRLATKNLFLKEITVSRITNCYYISVFAQVGEQTLRCQKVEQKKLRPKRVLPSAIFTMPPSHLVYGKSLHSCGL